MWVSRDEYKLNRKSPSYCIVLVTDPTKRVSTGFPTNLRAALLSENFPPLELIPAPAGQVEALTFSVDKAALGKRKNTSEHKWNLRLHKLRAYWYRHWKGVTHVWLELSVAVDCYLRVKIAYDVRRKQVPSV